MIEHTFCHVKGISEDTERRLWEEGISCWDDVFERERVVVGEKTWETLKRTCDASKRCLEEGRPYFFQSSLPVKEHWRLFSAFRDQVAYVDIETNGGNKHSGLITTIALYNGRDIHHYVHGYNLANIRQDLHRYKLLVTFNGKSFDVPFMESRLKMRIPHVHIDLCHVFRGLGIRGGLKKIEKRFGVDRGELDGVDGRLAIWLWQEYQREESFKAMDTLLAYNIEDTLNMETLMVHAWNLQLERFPFEKHHRLPLPVLPESPFQPDIPTVQRLLKRHRSR